MRDMRDMRDICHGCHGHDNPVRGRDIIGCSLREPQCHALDVTLWWFEYTAVFSHILGVYVVCAKRSVTSANVTLERRRV